MKKSRIASENQFSFVSPVFDNVGGLIGVWLSVIVSGFSSSTVKMLALYPIGIGFVSWWKAYGISHVLMKWNVEAFWISLLSYIRMLSILETERLQPVNLVLRKCLYPHISQKYYRVCTRLVLILKEEYRLMGYLAAMRVRRDPIQSTNCCSSLFRIS